MTDEMLEELRAIPELVNHTVRKFPVEVRIRQDGGVLWVNVGPKCILRIGGIKKIIVEDNRVEDNRVEDNRVEAEMGSK